MEIIQEQNKENKEIYNKILDEIKIQNKTNQNNKDIEELEIKLNKAEKEKENELKKLKNNFSGFKEELIEQYNSLLKDLDLTNNKLSLKDFHLMNIQKQIDKMDLRNKNLEGQIILILNENIQLKNEIKELVNKIEELNNLIKEREKEFVEENQGYKTEITKLKGEINKYKNFVEIKEKEKLKLEKRCKFIIDEKKILVDKITLLQDENDLDIENIRNKKGNPKNYKNIYIYEKDEEIKNLNEYILKIKKELNKIKEKKNYYKSKCKEFNQEIIKNFKE